uniref:RxLR effector protein n=1 Tax=Phytophthora agathidicida TaxID=1642459 RepID=A0A7G4WI28_9STRA|nr:PaRXLR39 [Phytophthora agathidicida]
MRKFLVLLVLAFVAFASSDALSAGSETKLAKSELQSNVAGKRMLRANDVTVDPAEEERGGAEVAAKFKVWAQSMKTWILNSKLVQAAQKQMQTLAQKKRVWDVKRMLNKGASNEALYLNKVTPDEILVAYRLDPKVTYFADSPATLAKNPGLEKFSSYLGFYNSLSNNKAIVPV